MKITTQRSGRCNACGHRHADGGIWLDKLVGRRLLGVFAIGAKVEFYFEPGEVWDDNYVAFNLDGGDEIELPSIALGRISQEEIDERNAVLADYEMLGHWYDAWAGHDGFKAAAHQAEVSRVNAEWQAIGEKYADSPTAVPA